MEIIDIFLESIVGLAILIWLLAVVLLIKEAFFSKEK